MHRYEGESNDQLIARAEVTEAVKNLFEVCKQYGMCVAGYVWGVTPPVFVQISNCREKGADLTALFLKLSTMAEEKEAGNNRVEEKVALNRKETIQ